LTRSYGNEEEDGGMLGEEADAEADSSVDVLTSSVTDANSVLPVLENDFVPSPANGDLIVMESYCIFPHTDDNVDDDLVDVLGWTIDDEP
jgi:hypothetical protein